MILTHGANSISGGGGVPEEYIELEYLQIDSDYADFCYELPNYFDNDCEISFLVEYDRSVDRSQSLLVMKGATPVNDDYSLYIASSIFNSGANKKIYSRNRDKPNNYTINTDVKNWNITSKSRYTVNSDKITIETINGDTFVIDTYYEKFTIKYFRIFVRDQNHTWPFIGKFFDLTVKQGNKEIFKLVAVKNKNSGLLGFFDTVSQTFYEPNYGQSNLIAGPVKL
jgi:hypothetical protein